MTDGNCGACGDNIETNHHPYPDLCLPCREAAMALDMMEDPDMAERQSERLAFALEELQHDEAAQRVLRRYISLLRVDAARTLVPVRRAGADQFHFDVQELYRIQ